MCPKMKRRINPEKFTLSGVCLNGDFNLHHVCPQYLKKITESFGCVTLASGNCKAIIEVEWAELLPGNPTTITIIASGCTKKSIKDDTIRTRHYSHLIDAYIHYVFLAANIASPGCISFYSSELKHSSLAEINNKFMLSGDTYGLMIATKNSNWPEICNLDINDVKVWLEKVGYGIKQIATTRTDKTLFSFLYLSTTNEWLLDGVLWISYALEGLYDTPAFNIKSAITKRIALLHGMPTAAVKKKLSRFYDIRSSFFHGRMKIPHPMHNEVLDQSLWDWDESDDVDCVALAGRVVIASIQQLVKNNFSHLTFTESLNGTPSGLDGS